MSLLSSGVRPLSPEPLFPGIPLLPFPESFLSGIPLVSSSPLGSIPNRLGLELRDSLE